MYYPPSEVKGFLIRSPNRNEADQKLLTWIDLGGLSVDRLAFIFFFLVTTRIESLEVYLTPVPGLIRGWGCINPARQWEEWKGAHGKILYMYMVYILVSMLIYWAKFKLYNKILRLLIKLYMLGYIKIHCLFLFCFCNAHIYDIADCISNNIIMYYIVCW